MIDGICILLPNRLIIFLLMRAVYLFILALLFTGLAAAAKKPMGFPWGKAKATIQ